MPIRTITTLIRIDRSLLRINAPPTGSVPGSPVVEKVGEPELPNYRYLLEIVLNI